MLLILGWGVSNTKVGNAAGSGFIFPDTASVTRVSLQGRHQDCGLLSFSGSGSTSNTSSQCQEMKPESSTIPYFHCNFEKFRLKVRLC
jgi:hypothetical protein